ncbi:MAG: 3'-5' exonuclease [Cyanobium sp.]
MANRSDSVSDHRRDTASHPPAAADGSGATPGWEQVDLLSFVGLATAPDPAGSARPAAAGPVSAPEVDATADANPDADPDAVDEPELRSAPQPAAGSPMASAHAGPTRLLILDTETTGLDPDQHHCIEVGAVLFDVPQRAVLQQISFLLPCADNPARGINGIDAAVSRQPQPWRQALQCFEAMLEAADAVLAHNAAFDRQWFGRGLLPSIAKPWLCSMEDLRWPPERQLRPNPSVRDLALAYGVPVWAAHRALTDCTYLVQVFERCPELELLLVAGLEPRRLYRARLSYEERHKAREAGFRWNEPVHGAWSRRLSEREAALLTFPVIAVEDAAALRRSA